MIIFKDLLTDDEVISDTWELKEIDGVVYEVDLKRVTVGGNVNIDIGANASAEGGDDEDVDEQSTTEFDVVAAFRLNKLEGGVDKKAFVSHIKKYMKRVKEGLQQKGSSEEEVKDFETRASGYVKKILANIGDYDVYLGESMDPDGMNLLLNFRDDGITPYLTIWKHGLKAMKV
ncbi:MAG: hypothetical protein M1833_005505 [Piccolia ochrophora]|nr:MAG: hypothetical protein M1833_005505 [Piccolia ochrophora]